MDLRNEFEQRDPWMTRFVIDGEEYGGNLHLTEDPRIDQFFELFSGVQTILELGSLEGGHTFALARHAGVEWVLGIEGRQANVDKAKFVQELLRIDNVEFRNLNLEVVDLSAFGRFDAVFCLGVLYHLPEPWRLVSQIARITRNLFIWTHYALEDRATERVHGFRGSVYHEQGLDDPLSGLSTHSFWPTLDSLLALLRRSGFRPKVIELEPDHPHGPRVTIAATVRLPWLQKLRWAGTRLLSTAAILKP